MVKQFTIPCQFQGGQTSPVTLYIGHPESTHHPVHFQSDWLSSAKGGTIPQDLMDTLQKLHDLANENGADFEELCYYALISATQHGVGDGVSQEDINKYADEYIKQEGNVDMGDTNGNEDNNAQQASMSAGQTTGGSNNNAGTTATNTNNTSTANAGGDFAKQMKDAEQVLSQSPVDEETKQGAEKVIQQIVPTINAQSTSADESNKSSADNASITDTTDTSGAGNDGIDANYSAEDEDLLLADDF